MHLCVWHRELVALSLLAALLLLLKLHVTSDYAENALLI